jgi:hypothetical protein
MSPLCISAYLPSCCSCLRKMFYLTHNHILFYNSRFFKCGFCYNDSRDSLGFFPPDQSTNDDVFILISLGKLHSCTYLIEYWYFILIRKLDIIESYNYNFRVTFVEIPSESILLFFLWLRNKTLKHYFLLIGFGCFIFWLQN